MKDDQTIEGRWWIHGTQKPPEFGSLDVPENGSLRLCVKVPNSKSFAEVMSMATENMLSTIPSVIFGKDQHDKPVTLFGCGGANHNLSGGMESYEIGAMAALKGMEIASWKQATIRAASIESGFLHRWLEQSVIKGIKLPDGREGWTIPELPEAVWDVCSGVRFRIDRQINPASSIDEFGIRPHHRIWFHFAEPKSLEEITEKWIPWTTRLLSLLVGSPVHYEEVECFPIDPFEEGIDGMLQYGELIRGANRKRTRTSPPYAPEMFAPFSTVSDKFGDILRSWYEVSNRFEPVVDLFAAVEFHHTLYSEAQFLFLVQALEVYHVRSAHFDSAALPADKHKERVETVVEKAPEELQDWLRRKIQSANYKPLDQRLQEIFDCHGDESPQLFGDNTAEIAERIRYTRNHLTHYSGKPDARLFDEVEMLRVNYSLRALIWICLLKGIGISGVPIRKIIHRHKGMRFVMLTEEQEAKKC